MTNAAHTIVETAPGNAVESSWAAWRVVVAGAVVMGFNATGLWGATFGLVMASMEHEFGWTRAQLTFGYTIAVLLNPLYAPIAGWLTDRVPLRPYICISLALQAVLFLAMSQLAGKLLFLYAGCALVPLFAYGASGLPMAKIVNEWFDRRRGAAMGTLFAVASLGPAAYPLLAHWFLSKGGWDWVFGGLGAVVLLVPLPLALIWVRQREPRAGAVVGACADSGEAATLSEVPGHSPREALRDAAFWWITAYMVLFSAGLATVSVHLIPLMTERGLNVGAAAGAQSMFGFGIMGGTMLAGLLLDRFHAPRVASAVLLGPVVAVVGLASFHGALSSFSMAALLGLSGGGESIFITYMVGRYFGQKAFGRIFALLSILLSGGAALGPWLAASVHDQTGTYGPVLVACGLVFGLAALPLFKLKAYRY
jgi:MFS family permease